MARKHDAAETAPEIRIPDRLSAGYIFDLDGTVYLGGALLPGARRVILTLRAMGRRVLFVSNNPTKAPAMYAEKLTALGIATAPGDVINTITTMTHWLLRYHPDATVFPIGEAPLKRALCEASIRISENPQEIDFVIASYDRTFTYQKLQVAFDALWYHKRARLITTNPDRYCPLPGGRGEPDAAAIIAAIEACSGVQCEVNVGKPDPIMLDTALDVLGLKAAECTMVGDRLYTDIRMGRRSGMPSALVLTGETTREALRAAPAEDQPTYVLERIEQLIPTRFWAAAGRATEGE